MDFRFKEYNIELWFAPYYEGIKLYYISLAEFKSKSSLGTPLSMLEFVNDARVLSNTLSDKSAYSLPSEASV